MTPYYEHGGITIYHGDCLEVMKELPSRYVDVVVTDPPYFLPATHYCTRRTFARSLSDLSILEHFYRDLFAECARVLKTSGVLYAFCDGQSYPVFYATCYPHVRRLLPLVWDKQIAFNGYTWRHQHELILFAEMEDAKPVPTGDGDIIRCRAIAIDDREHPAEKPVELLQRLCDKSVVKGGVVLDPFMGSGSTLLAAQALGVEAIGIERDGEYCREAVDRLNRCGIRAGNGQTVLNFAENAMGLDVDREATA